MRGLVRPATPRRSPAQVTQTGIFAFRVGQNGSQASNLEASSLTIFAATMAVRPETSRSGLYSTRSAATSGAWMPWMSEMASRTENPPGSQCETPGANAGIEHVEVKRYVHRAAEGDVRQRPAAFKLVNFNPKTFRLLALAPVHGANAYLHEARRESLLHDAGKRTGMGVPVAFEFVVEVGMRVEMQNSERREFRCDSVSERE